MKSTHPAANRIVGLPACRRIESRSSTTPAHGESLLHCAICPLRGRNYRGFAGKSSVYPVRASCSARASAYHVPVGHGWLFRRSFTRSRLFVEVLTMARPWRFPFLGSRHGDRNLARRNRSHDCAPLSLLTLER